MPIDDPLGAFMQQVEAVLPGARTGPLAGLRFAAKDIFDVARHVTGAGNPDWLATHAPAPATAPAVEALVAAGATMIGKTITDELAYSLNGENFHYGTPKNVNAPGRIPGGSSSGSAAAVAGGLVDFALGSDTGGSIRLPASLCGIFGLRPSHGRVPAARVVPLAPSFDVVGWFARDADLLARVGAVLLGPDPTPARLTTLCVAEDAFALAEEPVRAALRPAVDAATTLLGPAKPVDVGGEGGGLGAWMTVFRILQAREIWATHGDWIESAKPRFGPEIAARFAWAKSVAETPAGDEAARREAFTARLDGLLADGAVLCLPSAPSIAPLRDQPAEASQQFRDRTLSLTCIAGLARLPQVSLPAAQIEGCPVGFSLIARRGADRALLDLARELARRLNI
ncbi:amidase [Rhodospirillaceae bacterium SYSU D60014]|uniref:amidase n=1 Tax=Virgifigura deserti TaxID=2268457 RepID=UPI000E66D7D5